MIGCCKSRDLFYQSKSSYSAPKFVYAIDSAAINSLITTKNPSKSNIKQNVSVADSLCINYPLQFFIPQFFVPNKTIFQLKSQEELGIAPKCVAAVYSIVRDITTYVRHSYIAHFIPKRGLHLYIVLWETYLPTFPHTYIVHFIPKRGLYLLDQTSLSWPISVGSNSSCCRKALPWISPNYKNSSKKSQLSSILIGFA